jgi:hypothetical protein
MNTLSNIFWKVIGTIGRIVEWWKRKPKAPPAPVTTTTVEATPEKEPEFVPVLINLDKPSPTTPRLRAVKGKKTTPAVRVKKKAPAKKASRK